MNCSYALGYGERDKRDRDSYSRNNDRDNNYSQKNNYSEKSSSVDESKTIMLKGLPSHTTEPSVTLLKSTKSQLYIFVYLF